MYWYKASSKGAFILLMGWGLYIPLVIVDIPAESYIYYYSCATLINFIVGHLLQNVNILAALCSYSLVSVNILGAILWYHYLEPDIYNEISVTILIIQLIIITPKGLIDGIRSHRANRERTMAELGRFDVFQSCVKMLKNQTRKKT